MGSIKNIIKKLKQIMRTKNPECYEKEGLAEKNSEAMFFWLINKFGELYPDEVNRAKTELQAGKVLKVTTVCVEEVTKHYTANQTPDEDPQPSATEESVIEDYADQLTSSNEEQELTLEEIISNAVREKTKPEQQFIKKVMRRLKEKMGTENFEDRSWSLNLQCYNEDRLDQKISAEMVIWMINTCCELNPERLRWVKVNLKERKVLKVIKCCMQQVTTHYKIPRIWPKTHLKWLQYFYVNFEDYYTALGVERRQAATEG